MSAMRGRRRYRSAWQAMCAACCAIGCAIAVLADPPVVLGLLAVSAIGVACVVVTVRQQGERPSGRALLASTGVILLVALGTAGLITGLGSASVALIGLLTLTGAPLIDWDRLRARPSEPDPEEPGEPAGRHRPPVQAPPVQAPPVQALPPAPRPLVIPAPDDPDHSKTSTAALCWIWRTSFTALQRADGIDERLRIIHLRQSYLDELASREPHGFRKWLEEGARAAGDPTRYVCVRRPPEDS